ncbi:MAG: hypothetical protein ACJ8ER_05190 [Allosphingosinicella sp.]
MPYEQIVFIGYAIDTAPKEEPGDKKVYLGLPNPADDIKARCQLLRIALQKARDMIAPPSPPAKTLYVFMVPEFFFRGDTGAYTMAGVQFAIKKLQEIAADEQWTDWVFAFGTIVGRWDNLKLNPPTQICNFALVQQGGTAAQGPEGARAIMKELKSGIDFIAAEESAGGKGLFFGSVAYPKADATGSGREAQQANYDGAGIFQLNGITWALDICLDHLTGRLPRSPQIQGEDEVQLQLVPSCGASIVERGVIAQTGGYAFNVDGGSGWPSASLVEVASPLLKIPRAAANPVGVAVVPSAGSPPGVAVDRLYANGSGRIWVYDPVPMPPARKVTGTTLPPFEWDATPNWTFSFYLTFGEDGQLTSAMVNIHSRDSRFNFGGKKYDLPLAKDGLPLSLFVTPEGWESDPIQRTAKVEMWWTPGGEGYDNAIWANIGVPRFKFYGCAMQFMNSMGDPKEVELCWLPEKSRKPR